MKHYLFVIEDEGSNIDGEEFLVGANNISQAKKIAKRYFEENIVCRGLVSETEAEMSGLDEY